MEGNVVSKGAFKRHQNKFRGLVSAYKSRKFVADRKAKPSASFCLGLRELFLDARWSLSPSQFDAFISWINRQIQNRFQDYINREVGYEELSGIYTRAPVVPLARELLWITSRINADANKINSFRSIAQDVESLVYSDKIEEAIETIKEIEKYFGVSLWSVQLRIALEHIAGGLERQKRYTAEVRGVYRRGLLGFIAYYTSVRNEDRSSFAKFRDDINARIDSNQYEAFVKTYARYRLTGDMPTSEHGFADIFRAEQSNSVIDVYETFIAIAQEIVRRDDLTETRNILSKCLHKLSNISDFRLAKMVNLIDGEHASRNFSCRSTNIFKSLLVSDVKLARRNSVYTLKTAAGIDPWQYIYAGVALSHAARLRPGIVGVPSNIPLLIGRVISESMTCGDSYAQLKKMTINLGGFPTSIGIIDFLPFLCRPCPDHLWRPWLIGMNSRTCGVEDTTQITYQEYLSIKAAKGQEKDITDEVWGGIHGRTFERSDVSLDAFELFTSIGLLGKGEFQLAAETLAARQRDTKPNSLNSIAASMLLHAYFSLGDRQAVIELISDEGSRCPARNQLLPIKSTLEHYAWQDFKNVSSPLSSAIALHLLWTIDEKDITASYLRYATGKVIKNSGVGLPSKFIDIVDEYPKHQLVYFLRYICVPKILDASRALKSSYEVMGERQAICTGLRYMDPTNSDIYQEEVMAISNQLALDDGQRIVDSTRVHVDTLALSRWATREFSDDYSRYRDLLDLDIEETQNYDDVLKELATNASSRRTSFTPENEADAVLVSILSRFGEEFLYNPSFGFDFYLSKRIRHQSFIGFIRGPLEFAHLITTRASEAGVYHRNYYWLDKFTNLSQAEIEELNDIITKFSAKFDDILLKAKDTKFQLFTRERPTGLLYLDFSPKIISIVRAIIRMDTTISEFNETVIAILWAALEPSLVEVRRYITEEMKTRVSSTFDEFRANVRRIAGHDVVSLELDMVIGRCSTDVQRALDEVAVWFSHADLEAQKRSFSLEQIVDIAIDYVLRCQRAFEPQITRQVDQNFEMPSSNLVMVHDALFIALDNVRIHSGLKKPKVNIAVDANICDATLTIDVLSESKEQNRVKHEEVLREIRQMIDAGKVGRRTRIEGRSGILKLAAVVQQSSKGRIEFGFTDDGQFRLKVTYSLVMLDPDQLGGDSE